MKPFCPLFRKTNTAVFVCRERGQVTQTQCVWCPGAADLPLFDCFVLVHVDGGDGMLGAGLHLPVHLPLGVFRLGLEQVHPLLCFDPAGNGERGEKKEKNESILLEAMIYVPGQRSAPSVCSSPPLSIASWQKQFHR